MSREGFGTRMGFIMMSVACAIGLGNVWLLPYRVGVYGGGVYLFLFAIFLFIFSVPVLVSEFAIGRASQQSILTAHGVLAPKKPAWQIHGWMGVAGNYFLTMFYSVVVGLTLVYTIRAFGGQFANLQPGESLQIWLATASNPVFTLGSTWAVIIFCCICCWIGLKNGVERVGKYMMFVFFVLVVIGMFRALTLPGAVYGLRFLFVPDWQRAIEVEGLPRLLHLAMGQAFFSLSVGIGSMTIFGSYIKKQRTLLGEAVPVAGLDIMASVICLLMIFPAAFAFQINVNMPGGGLLFVIIPNIVNAMPGAYFWSVLFYVSFFFVAVTTQLAVVENIIAIGMDKFGWTRQKSAMINLGLLMLLVIPGALSQPGNVLVGTTILGMPFAGFFTFIVSDNLLPLGSVLFAVFCAHKFGWGWDDFIAEANSGKGWKFPTSLRFYYAYVIPLVALGVYFYGLFWRFIRPLLG